MGILFYGVSIQKMIKMIKSEINKNICLYSLCIWNDRYLLSGGFDSSFKVYNLDENKLIYSIEDKDSKSLIDIKKLKFKETSEIVITSRIMGIIDIWKIKN